MYEDLEAKLREKTIDPNTRRVIRNSKILIVDDKIEDLDSLLSVLKNEGFTNIVTLNEVKTINDILKEGYDLIILDLKGVAEKLSDEDGIGVLSKLKKDDPSTLIFVVSAQTYTASTAKTLMKADLIRNKPVEPLELVDDVEALLQWRKDPFWATISILRELETFMNKDVKGLGWWRKLKITKLKSKLLRNIKEDDPKITNNVENLIAVMSDYKDEATLLLKIGSSLIIPG